MWGLGQALRATNGLPPGVWNRSFSRQYEVTAPLLVGQVYYLTCWQYGDNVVGPYGDSVLWYRVTSGGFVSNALLYTGVGPRRLLAGVDRC